MNRNPVEVDPKWNIRVLESEEKKDELILINSTCLAYRNTWIDFVRDIVAKMMDFFYHLVMTSYMHVKQIAYTVIEGKPLAFHRFS